MLVYKITNLVTGNAYIGVTVNALNLRWNQHVHSARKGSTLPLQRAILKYGKAAFSVHVLYECTSLLEMLACEKALIAAHGTMVPNGYNVTTGGEGFAGKRSPETRRKMSEARQRLAASGWKPPGRKYTDEQRAEQSAMFKGRRVSEDTKRKISTTLKANPKVIAQARAAAYLNHERNRLRPISDDERIMKRDARRTHSSATRKLTVDEVAVIRARLILNESPLKISREYSVSDATIHDIKNGKTWKDVQPGFSIKYNGSIYGVCR